MNCLRLSATFAGSERGVWLVCAQRHSLFERADCMACLWVDVCSRVVLWGAVSVAGKLKLAAFSKIDVTDLQISFCHFFLRICIPKNNKNQ